MITSSVDTRLIQQSLVNDLVREVTDRETTVMFKGQVELEYFARSTLEELVCEQTASLVESQYEEEVVCSQIASELID